MEIGLIITREYTSLPTQNFPSRPVIRSIPVPSFTVHNDSGYSGYPIILSPTIYLKSSCFSTWDFTINPTTSRAPPYTFFDDDVTILRQVFRNDKNTRFMPVLVLLVGCDAEKNHYASSAGSWSNKVVCEMDAGKLDVADMRQVVSECGKDHTIYLITNTDDYIAAGHSLEDLESLITTADAAVFLSISSLSILGPSIPRRAHTIFDSQLPPDYTRNLFIKQLQSLVTKTVMSRAGFSPYVTAASHGKKPAQELVDNGQLEDDVTGYMGEIIEAVDQRSKREPEMKPSEVRGIVTKLVQEVSLKQRMIVPIDVLTGQAKS